MDEETLLPRWRRTWLGDGIALTPPQGPALGAVRIREEQRPLLSAAAIFARADGRMPASDRGPIQRLVTSEGEPAAFRIARGERDGHPFVRCLGAVFGDDSYTLIDASTAAPDRFAFFEQAARLLTVHCSLGLGYARRRRFGYRPPPGWEGTARGLDADWRHPEYPAVDVRLTVHAAEPGAAALRDAMLARFGPLPVARPYARAGLHGAVHCGMVGGRHVDVCVLDDGRFGYAIEVHGQAHEALAALLESIEPVPGLAGRPAAESSLHWAD